MTMRKDDFDSLAMGRDISRRAILTQAGTGRIRELIDSGHSVVLVTHWQLLYTQGTGLGLGLEGLATLAERIQEVCGSSLEWVSCSEPARRYVASAKPGALG